MKKPKPLIDRVVDNLIETMNRFEKNLEREFPMGKALDQKVKDKTQRIVK